METQITVIRSKRRTMSLSVSREGKVVVRAPYAVSEKHISDFVTRHQRWLQKRLSQHAAVPTFADGEKIPICGVEYTIATGKSTKLAGDILYLPLEGREKALISLLRRITRARMKEQLARICADHGLSYTKLTVTSARGRWGSCSAKRHISFTFRTAFLPDALAEYLAAHELCHTLHMDHSKAFWREVERIVPDYASRRRELKQYLWAMNCL